MAVRIKNITLYIYCGSKIVKAIFPNQYPDIWFIHGQYRNDNGNKCFKLWTFKPFNPEKRPILHTKKRDMGKGKDGTLLTKKEVGGCRQGEIKWLRGKIRFLTGWFINFRFWLTILKKIFRLISLYLGQIIIYDITLLDGEMN